jgi:putative tricarboxylic transport membrane protein
MNTGSDTAMLEGLIAGISNMLVVRNLLFMNVGLLAGIVFGAIPGLTVLLAIVLFLPFTFVMSGASGILMLLGIYCGGTYGGSISAILIKTPGTPNAAATVLDGYPLARKGQARKALLAALFASVIGGIVSAFVLLFAAPQIAKATRFFGPAEYFSLAVFGISIIAGISGGKLLKGLMTGCLGILISMIGQDYTTGVFRFSFGLIDLAGGVDLVPTLIGLFAISELLIKAKNRSSIQIGKESITMDSTSKLTFAELGKSWVTLLRATIIGIIIGAIPGTGGGIASFLSYNDAQKRSKHPEEFGNGAQEGILAPEAANNAVTGGALIPTIALGVPGDAVSAVMLGALMINGLIPGSRIFIDHRDTMYTILVGLIVINFFMLLQGRYLIRFFAMVTKIPDQLLMPLLFVLCTAGSFAVSNSVFSVYVMLVFGVLSYFLIHLGYPIVPMLLGIILGPMAESNLKRALTISDGSLSIFFTRPISLAFIVLTLIGAYTNLRREPKSGRQ